MIMASAIKSILFLASAATAALHPAEIYFSGLDQEEKREYKSWLNSNVSSYARHEFLSSQEDPGIGAAVFWSINDDIINFAVAVRATGWLGFGISAAGGMLGADVAMFEANAPEENDAIKQSRTSVLPGSPNFYDTYILEDRAVPIVDDCQDWSLNSATVEGGWIIVEMSRKLDTGDNQDHPIVNDVDLWNAPTNLITAWGDDDVVYHGMNRAKLSVRLFADDPYAENTDVLALSEKLAENADGYFELREENNIIPTDKTTYHHLCKSFDEIRDDLNLPEGQSMVTMIGAEPVVTAETAALVHHFLVYSVRDCTEESFEQSLIYAWAPGNDGLMFPDDVGFPLFDAENTQALLLEIHYNNPSGIADLQDSSGVKFHFTHEERSNSAGVLMLGDPYVQLYGQEISDGLTEYEFTCPSSCSSAFLGNQSVTVLTETLHMHQTGVQMSNELIRDGSVVHEARVDVYEFEQQGNFLVQQAPYEVKAGDRFRTTCYYRDGTAFGLGSEEEMCIAFLFYYPAMSYFNQEFNINLPWTCPYGVDDPVCDQELYSRTLDSDEELGRKFGSSSTECAGEKFDRDVPAEPIATPVEGDEEEESDPYFSVDIAGVSFEVSGSIGWNGVLMAGFLCVGNLFVIMG